MSVHNIDYYRGLWGKYQEFQDNNQIRRENASYLNPENRIIYPLSCRITNFLMKPTTYQPIGKAAIKITRFFSTRISSRLEALWNDPISTERMLEIGHWVQAKARVNAVRKPISLPFFYYLDRALISASRHAYIVAKDLNALLSIPKGLRDYLHPPVEAEVEVEVPNREEQPTSLAGRAWMWIKRGTARVKIAILALIQRIISAVRIPLQYMPLVEKGLVKLSDLLEKARERLHNSLLDKVHKVVHKVVDKVIESGEEKIRDQVVAKVTEVAACQTIRFGVSSGLKVCIGAGTYLLAKHAFTHFTGVHDLPPAVLQVLPKVLTIAGAYLWVRCMTPTLQGFYEDYDENFNPEASTLFEIRSLFDKKNFGAIFSHLKKKFV
ncbi:MAG: hypothetical protein KR126chlam3_00789 [Chlamydiae bacterium]|nr:hypothetical protein [Chlamydiota bacterium]